MANRAPRPAGCGFEMLDPLITNPIRNVLSVHLGEAGQGIKKAADRAKDFIGDGSTLVVSFADGQFELRMATAEPG